MRRFDSYCVFLLLTCIKFLFLRTYGGRFPPFSNDGKAPKKASKGPRDLTLCRVFRRKTCCDVAQTHPALFTALLPCGLGDFVCGRASEWVSNGTELCHASGFSVVSSDDPDEALCYGGKGSLDYVANSWKTSQSEVSASSREQETWALDDFRQWVFDRPFNERVSWAVGGMVLTAGLLFVSKRKTLNQRQKLAAIQRTATARRLGTKLNSAAPVVSQGNRKGIGR
ncbi:hypothetical protein PHJA_002066800 [Phtheirospermum japonicum]|uniref:Transmembrane protein n=1 Tax=Phtheirospermum japonicum TaxID=374723 RepID=A0A830CJQ6_9LAMI|nr:hypothetical protein PHJA_002066800 [Phtheirospermum japonicum]